MTLEVNLTKERIDRNSIISNNISVNAGELLVGSDSELKKNLTINTGKVTTDRNVRIRNISLNASIFDSGKNNTLGSISNKAGAVCLNKDTIVDGDIDSEAGTLSTDRTRIKGDIIATLSNISLLNSSRGNR